MQITIKVDGKDKTFKSIKQPQMFQIRIGTKLVEAQELIQNGSPKEQLALIDELIDFVRKTFPNMTEKDADCIDINKFFPLIQKIISWANSGGDTTQKKT